MKKYGHLLKIAAVIASVCLICQTVVFAQEAESEKTEPEVKNEFQIELINGLDKDINFLAVLTLKEYLDREDEVVIVQKALIEKNILDDAADGSYGPMTQAAVAAFRIGNNLPQEGGIDSQMLTLLLGEGYEGNLLKKDEIIEKGEGYALKYVLSEDSKEIPEGNDETDNTDKQENDFTDYILIVRSADNTEYVLHYFPLDTIKSASIVSEEDVVFLRYRDEEGNEADTFDSEKVLYDAQEAVKTYNAQNGQAFYDSADDWGYNDSYDDWGYDDGYDDWNYDDAPYVVSSVDYPSCDDGSHGFTEITYSDGSVEYVVY